MISLLLWEVLTFGKVYGEQIPVLVKICLNVGIFSYRPELFRVLCQLTGLDMI